MFDRHLPWRYVRHRGAEFVLPALGPVMCHWGQGHLGASWQEGRERSSLKRLPSVLPTLSSSLIPFNVSVCTARGLACQGHRPPRESSWSLIPCTAAILTGGVCQGGDGQALEAEDGTARLSPAGLGLADVRGAGPGVFLQARSRERRLDRGRHIPAEPVGGGRAQVETSGFGKHTFLELLSLEGGRVCSQKSNGKGSAREITQSSSGWGQAAVEVGTGERAGKRQTQRQRGPGGWGAQGERQRARESERSSVSRRETDRQTQTQTQRQRQRQRDRQRETQRERGRETDTQTETEEERASRACSEHRAENELLSKEDERLHSTRVITHPHTQRTLKAASTLLHPVGGNAQTAAK